MPPISHLVRRPTLIRLPGALLIVLSLLATPLAAQEPTAVIGGVERAVVRPDRGPGHAE